MKTKRTSQGLFIQQVKALLWRNYMLKMSNKGKTISEFLLPILFVLCLASLKTGVTKGQDSKADDQPVYIGKTPYSFVSDSYLSPIIMFAPNTTTVSDVAQNAVQALNSAHVLRSYMYEMHDNVSSINEMYQSNSSYYKVAVIFDDDPLKNGSYTIKMPASNLPLTNQLYIDTKSLCRGNNGSLLVSCPTLRYYYHGFSNLQSAVDSALLKLWSGNPSISVPSAGLYFLPRGSFKVSSQAWESLVPMYLIISFTPLITILSTYIVLEKEKKIKEAMLMMGMKISAYWVSWFLTEFCVVLFTSVTTVVVMYAIGIFSSSSLVVIFSLVLLFGLSTIMIAFMMTPFFNKHQVAGSVSGFAILIFSLFYLLAIFLKGKVSSVVFHITALLSPTAYALALVKLLQNESVGIELSSSNFFSGDFSVGSGIIMLFVDVILYGLLAFYFDNVIPGEYGTRQSPWFCFLPKFWSKGPDACSNASDRVSELTNTSEWDVEEVSDDLKAKNVVKIRGLTKIYSKGSQAGKILAVNDFSLDIYEGQITALLGHNGAGKTTLINMLVGMLEPTDGTAWIYGSNIKNAQDICNLRSKTGVCLQEDILFDDMNARQHLEFFARLKALPAGEVKRRVDDLLSELDLSQSACTKSKDLSGGQKRKLCVAIALIGDPKLLVLDEPSSGLDPHSRRKLWTLLESYKGDRVIILTTHFMDEADILADRKAIVSNGKLRCAGSSLYLKKKFGVGYRLTVTVNADESICSKVTDVIQGVIPSAQLYRITASEFSYTLPTDETPHFPDLFDVLDQEIKSGMLHILSYGVSMTTLEEVFLKLGEENPNDSNNESAHQEYMEVHGDTSSDINFVSATTYQDSVFYPCVAYLKARLLLATRNIKNIALILIMPIVILILTYVLMKNGSNISSALQGGPLMLTPSVYPSAPFKLVNLTRTSVEDFVTALEDQGLVVNYLSALPTLHDVNYTDFLAAVLNEYDPKLYHASWKWMFNSDYQHALPILQSIMSNSFWAGIDNNKNQLSRKLVTTYDPFPLTKAEALKGFDPNTYFFVLFFGMLFAYIPTGVSVEVVEDRANKLKNQLKVSGFGYFSYWNMTLAVHSILFLIDVILLLIILSFMDIPFMKNPSVALLVWLLFLFFIPTSLLYCYVVCHLFNKPETAKSMVNILCYLPTMIFSTAVMMLDLFGVTHVAATLHYIFGFLFPFYVPPGTLYYLLSAMKTQEYLSHFGLPTSNTFYFEWQNHVIVCFVMMAFQIVALSVLLRILDTLKEGGNLKDALCSRADESHLVVLDESDSEELDDDIAQEQTFVKQCKQDGLQMPVLIDRLHKVYKLSSGKPCRKVEETKIAVKNLSIAVRSGNIFGLLGPNGAGKTSTLKMMVGEERISSGSISLFGHNISCNNANALRVLGYCPQYDALWNKLTIREHLNLYAVIKGHHPSEVNAVSKDIMDALRITEHADKRVEELSGGTKRKLSYAISVLGRSEIVLLDEPSTGMDPQSKNYFWNTIIKFFPSVGAKSAVLTTHSMEEAEVLCSRVGIMVKGSLRCLGPIQHLKDKYGQGYTLDIKVVTSSSEVHEYIMYLLPSAIKKSSSQDKLTYTVAQKDIPSLSMVFLSLEKAKDELRIIEEYSFSQVTLEQVFLGIMKEHHFGD